MEASASVLLADELAWEGHRATLVLRLEPGRGSVLAELPVGAAARASVELAVRVGLGTEAERWNARWTLILPENLPVQLVEGDSLGLAAAVAAYAACRGLRVPPDVAFCGRVRNDGDLEPVGAIGLKAAAAAAAGVTVLVVPPGTEPFAAPAREEQPSLSNLAARLWPSRPTRRWPGLVLLGLALATGPALISFGWLAKEDSRIARSAMAFRPLSPRRTALVYVPELERLPEGTKRYDERRDRLPTLLRQLAAARVSTVTFDRALHRADPSDEQLADAIRETSPHTSVIMALYADGDEALPLSPTLMALVGEGVLRVGHASFSSLEVDRDTVDRIPLYQLDGRGDLLWHVAIETVSARTRAGARRQHEGPWLNVGATRNQVELSTLALWPVDAPPCLLWVDPAAAPVDRGPELQECAVVTDLSDRAELLGMSVVVGVPTEDDQVVIDGRLVPGARAIAGAIEVVLQEAAPRRPTRDARFLGSAGLALILGLLARLAPARWSPRLLLPGLLGLLLLALLICVASGERVDVLPTLLGAALALAAGRLLR